MSVTLNQVRSGLFLDSVVLMQISRSLASGEGVEDAALMMATPANLEILSDAGLLAEDRPAAGPADLLIAVRASDQAAGEMALVLAAAGLEKPGVAAPGEAYQPRTLQGAARLNPEANLALISVPGDFAGLEARKALRSGLNVMIFSDNVPLEEEIALKREASERGLIVMGPDCGTAIIGGVPLAFANCVPRGDIGIVGASGTGIQEVTSLIARNGGGISHAIGVGGRDLAEPVAGISTLTALEWLEGDASTAHVVIISKPPAVSVADRILKTVARSSKTFTVCFLGAGDLGLPVNATLATTLKDAAVTALAGRWAPAPFDPRKQAQPVDSERRRILGLFSGGSLSAEAQTVLIDRGHHVTSNAPVAGAGAVLKGGAAHELIDLGDDAYTRGRPHPMIDPAVRDAPLIEALSDRGIGVILLDVVIGYGAHPDPAGHLAGVLKAHTGGGPLVVASVTGTETDPQGWSRQASILTGAGVLVAPSNADAAALALACLDAR